MGLSHRAPLVSFLIATFNRRDVLLRTLGEVNRCGLSADAFEILVIDKGLDAEKGGKSPDPASTKPYGCSVKYE